jgi:GrpB-like predicted nucleotidyltransferase (UPF0157 family)
MTRPDLPEPGTPEHARLQALIARLVAEEVTIADPDPAWPARFEEEAARLRALLPAGLIGRIEHFGSTAVPGLPAKPIVDLLAETPDLERVRDEAPAILEPLGYDCLWRPTGADQKPFYAWFIRRGADGRRTHHIHVVGRDFPQWEGLLFRDWLRGHPEDAAEYAVLKRRAAAETADRAAYTAAKSDFIRRVVERAKAAC